MKETNHKKPFSGKLFTATTCTVYLQ